MHTNVTVKSLNNLIGGWWTTVGFFLFIGAGVWFLGLFFTDLFTAWFGDAPLPNDLGDVILILSLLFVAVFLMGCGSAIVNRQEWGAWAGGLLHLNLTIYAAAACVIFYAFGPARWLENEAALSFYNRYAWLLWLLSIALLGILIGTTLFFLLSKSRQAYYAEYYQTLPPPLTPTCAVCGLIVRAGKCPACDRLTQEGWVTIGSRRERLLFTEDEPAFVIGRQKDKNEAYITLSEEDTQHPERISGRHLLIQYHFETKQFTVQDLASLNKTYLNGDETPLSPHTPYPLTPGAEIDLAHAVTLIFEVYEETS